MSASGRIPRSSISGRISAALPSRPTLSRLGRGPNDLQRLVDAGRATVEVARFEPLLDAAFLNLDGDAVRTGHDRRERLRAAHPAEAGGQDPAALEIAAIMLAAHLGEGLVGALDDALRADVDPAAGGHLAVHHQPLAIELVEHLPIGPFGHEVGVGDEHPRRVLVGAEHADRLARLDEQGLVLLEPLERLDDLVVSIASCARRGRCRRRRPGSADPRRPRRRGCSSASAPRLRWPSSWPRSRCRGGRGYGGCCRVGRSRLLLLAGGSVRPKGARKLAFIRERPSIGFGRRRGQWQRLRNQDRTRQSP